MYSGKHLLLRSRTSKDNFVIFAELLPLILIKSDQFWAAQDDGPAIAGLVRYIDNFLPVILVNGSRNRESVISRKCGDSFDHVGWVSNNTTFGCDGLSCEGKVSSDHKDSDTSSTKSGNDRSVEPQVSLCSKEKTPNAHLRNLVAWWIDNTNNANKYKTSPSMMHDFVLKVDRSRCVDHLLLANGLASQEDHTLSLR